MTYYLVKSEPSVYSWDQFVQDGITRWDGVRNYAARNNLRAMQTGDQLFYYHSNEGLEIVGIAEVVKEAYPDPTAEGDVWSAVDIRPVKPLKKPVSLAVIKQTESLQEMALIKLSRLSVSTVTEKEFRLICKMGGLK